MLEELKEFEEKVPYTTSKYVTCKTRKIRQTGQYGMCDICKWEISTLKGQKCRAKSQITMMAFDDDDGL